ncbi:MAG: CRISPR-associated endoribonuclease Cas6 [Firmicutes bacterium]|nr:CRISPR-associated endoribonuclease Cas6 [Bacillota bacterium]
MSVLKKYRLELECLEPGFVYGLGGTECHGLFFAMLANNAVATKIHDTDSNPFSLSPLRGSGQRSKGRFHLESGQRYFFTVAALNREMSEALIPMLEQVRPEHNLRLGSATCRWLKWTLLLESDYQKLKTRPGEAKHLTIRFSSPTSFRSQGQQLLFPEPQLVFNSLKERWNRCAPECLNLPELDTRLMVSRYQLETSFIKFSKYGQLGFTGSVEYTFAPYIEPDVKKTIIALAHYAAFAGIGYKTGMGMGEASLQ